MEEGGLSPEQERAAHDAVAHGPPNTTSSSGRVQNLPETSSRPRSPLFWRSFAETQMRGGLPLSRSVPSSYPVRREWEGDMASSQRAQTLNLDVRCGLFSRKGAPAVIRRGASRQRMAPVWLLPLVGDLPAAGC